MRIRMRSLENPANVVSCLSKPKKAKILNYGYVKTLSRAGCGLRWVLRAQSPQREQGITLARAAGSFMICSRAALGLETPSRRTGGRSTARRGIAERVRLRRAP